MGRGDKRTGKGKQFRGSYGKTRPHKVRKTVTKTAEKPAKAK